MARTRTLLLFVGIGFAGIFFPRWNPSQATTPNRAMIDASRVAALREVMHRRGLSLKPEDLPKLTASGKSFLPAKFEDCVNRRRPPVHASKGKPQNKDHAPTQQAGTEKLAASPAKPKDKDPSPSKDTTTAYNPYPQGPLPTSPAVPGGYHPLVRVTGPSRLDWTFVSSHWSLDPAPSLEMAGYRPTGQTYELYVPPPTTPRRPSPLILFITAGRQSDGWLHWQQVCRRRGVMLAGVHNAGNDVPMPIRVRIALDVLDDVRRRFVIDPDRTYISGMSGGGMAASHIAFALPELFGALIPICGTWSLRSEPMLRQRVTERLSVALVTGTGDFMRRETEVEYFPILQAHGARTRLWTFGMGHAYPKPWQLDQVFEWVEAGLLQRRLSSAVYPASRLIGPVSPDAWSTAALLEAGQRLEQPEGLEAGLFFLQGIAERWKGLPAADLANQFLDEFDTASPVPWKEIYRAERLRFAYVRAKAYDTNFYGPQPAYFQNMRGNMIQIELSLWNDVLQFAPADSPIAREAKDALARVHRLAGH
jgi:predicted esterase